MKKAAMIGMPDKAEASTGHVERHNLTIRLSLRRFTRLANAHSKKIESHICSIAKFFMFYNYCRAHSSLEGETTPAMAAGLSDHVWTLEEWIGLLS